MKKVLITGGSGFIGRNIVESLHNDYEVFVPSSRELDLQNIHSVGEFLENNYFDVVIHAATRNTTRKIISPYECLDGNLRMYYNLKKYSHLYGKMIYLGSGAEYDSEHYIPKMREEYLGMFIPNDPYGFSKYIMAKDCENTNNIYELCLFGVYGKYEEWERRFISNAICRALKGLDITIQKHVKFDYLWIEDFCKILIWFIENVPKYHRYNVCRGESIDLYDLAIMIKKELIFSGNIIVKESGWKREYSGDNSRLLNEIGKLSFTSYADTIKPLSDFYQMNIASITTEKL